MIMPSKDEDRDIWVYTTDGIEDGGPFAIGSIYGHVACDDAAQERDGR
jgi:hypothetical protein